MQNRWFFYVSGTSSPIISLAISMARRSLNDSPTWSCGIGDWLATKSWVSIVDVGGLGAPPPESTGGSPTLFCRACGDAVSRRIPGMEMLSGRKWIIASVHVSGTRYGHLTNSELVNTFRKILLNVDIVNLFSSKIRSRLSYTQLWESHIICILHVATSRLPIRRLLAWPISTCKSYSSRGCQGLPRHTIMDIKSP